MLLETYKKILCRHLEFGFAAEPWELDGYWNLRKEIFCKEQQIFKETDKDEHDLLGIPIISTCSCMGMNDQVIGVVRIDERAPGTWFGSRLGVAGDYRTLSRFKAYHIFADNAPSPLFTISVGASLIYKAVSTATALGCQKFYANVQVQNVPFFERLHWKTIDTITLHQQVHHRMEADLQFYPPSAFASAIRITA